MFSEFETSAIDSAEAHPASTGAQERRPDAPAPSEAPAAPDQGAPVPAASAESTGTNQTVTSNSTADAVENTEKIENAVATAPEHAEKAALESAPGEAAAEAASDENAIPSAEELSQLMDQYSSPHQAPVEGEVLEGRIVAVSAIGAVVDIGGKTEGLIPASEFLDADNPIKLEPGLTIEVQPTGEHKEGYVILSYQRAHRRKVWADIEKAYREKTHLMAKIVDRVKGGLVVDVGVRAFLPASQADSKPVHDLENWKDQQIEVRVLKLNRKRGNVVVSRRLILDEAQQAQREKLKDTLQEGQVLHGTVKSITSYGVFVDLGGIDGLLHVSDLSWGRVANPVDVVRPGDELEVQVLKFDREKMRVSLGRRQLLPDPWLTVPERFPAGTRAQGKVMGITDYGVFVEIEPGVEGLVHVSEMSWSKRKQHPSKLVQAGDPVEVVVLEVKPEQRRISLGIKQAQTDPWAELAQKYPVGTKVSGRIRNMTEFGAFVEIEEGFDGLIHVSDISWTGRVKNPSDVFKKGDAVEAKVLKIDAANRRVSLGVKQLNDIWSNWCSSHKINDVVRGKVSRLTTFGAFVELAEGVEGLCHISEIEERRRDKSENQGQGQSQGQKRDAGSAVLAPGREYDFKIVKFNPEQHKIGLSYRAAVRQSERREMEEYRSSRSSSTATIGDAIQAKRGGH